MSDADIGYGTLFKRGDGASPEVFAAIAEVQEITPPNLQRGTVDVTHQQSPDGYKEFIGALRDGGEVTVVMNYLPGNAGQESLLTDFNADDARNYKVVFPDADETTWSFAAIVTALGQAVPIEGKMTQTVTLKITGKPTLAAAA